VRTAVLVDAENMACGLRRVDSHAAAVFAEHPALWLDWLAGQTYPALTYPALTVQGPFARRLLSRVCFLNSDTARGLRAGFVRAGFDIVDCPSLTSAGKNAADIHLVIAMLDLLTHPTRYDEVILLSSDTDFTPVLTRLRAHDRRTVVIASGPHSPLLAAACDHLIPAADFASALTALSPKTQPAKAKKAAKKASVAKKATEKKSTATQTAAKKVTAKKDTAKKDTAKKAADKKSVAAKGAAATTGTPATAAVTKKATTAKTAAAKKATAGKAVSAPGPVPVAEDLAQAHALVVAAVTEIVASRPGPVPMAALAPAVRAALGPHFSLDWAGARGLKKLLQSLDLLGLAITEKGPGHVYDPARHQP
jgi:hypothetical protein